jgi:hypothetical protein
MYRMQLRLRRAVPQPLGKGPCSGSPPPTIALLVQLGPHNPALARRACDCERRSSVTVRRHPRLRGAIAGHASRVLLCRDK